MSSALALPVKRQSSFNGETEKLNDVFAYHPNDTWVTFKITECIPDKKIVWHVTDCYLHFQNNKTEWNNTDVVFEIAKNGNSTQINFTHRAYRIKGATWIEIDEPAVIEFKNEKLPVAECKNPLERIAINFKTEKLADKLSPYTNRTNLIFIIEGVLMYLSMTQRETLLTTLTILFSDHVVFCDLMSKNFLKNWESLFMKSLKRKVLHLQT